MPEISASWAALLALGAGHGINPAMGWLFAVALGFQRGSRRAVWSALGPLAAGHAVAMAVTIAAAAAVDLVLSPDMLKWVVAGMLVGVGIYRLVRSRHPSLRSGRAYGGMTVNGRELATWSFLMATAHGAGLMVLPLVLGSPHIPSHVHHMAAGVLGAGSIESSGVAAAMVHTVGYLLVTGLIAVIVYEKVGVRFLRTAWVNLDLLWAVALVITGGATLVF